MSCVRCNIKIRTTNAFVFVNNNIWEICGICKNFVGLPAMWALVPENFRNLRLKQNNIFNAHSLGYFFQILLKMSQFSS